MLFFTYFSCLISTVSSDLYIWDKWDSLKQTSRNPFLVHPDFLAALKFVLLVEHLEEFACCFCCSLAMAAVSFTKHFQLFHPSCRAHLKVVDHQFDK